MWNRTSIALVVTAAVVACSSQASGPRAPDTAPRSELGVFMKTKLNPPFSKLSYLLFHDETAGDATELAAAATAMITASEELMKWPSPPGDDEQGRLVFYEYAGTLKRDASELLDAVKANDKAAGQQQFTELRKKCDSCHHFFRWEGKI